jgi:glycosyltransferase involved in cell wall biosynthesis
MTRGEKKRIWLVKVGEPAPVDDDGTRLLRGGILSRRLAAAGHDVTWWQSTVNHKKKTQRFDEHTTVSMEEGLRLVFLHGRLYRRSVGLGRIVNQYEIAKAFERLAEEQEPPDSIVCALPPLEISLAAVEFGRRRGLPVILDVMDLWPDAFMKFSPDWLKPVWRRMLWPWFRMARRACAGATAITGPTDAYVDWGIANAGRARTPRDVEFPFGYTSAEPDEAEVREAEKKWDELGVGRYPDQFVFCFFGFFGRHYEIEVVVEAARRLEDGARPFKFVLCGTGDNLERYRDQAAGCASVLLPGWANQADIWTLMRRSAAGLAPYKQTHTMSRNLTNKPIEYWSAGLPVVSSLKGVLERTLAENDCGVTYECGDVDGLVDILTKLSDSPERLRSMSENAHRLYLEKFTAESVYGAMVRHIERICGWS